MRFCNLVNIHLQFYARDLFRVEDCFSIVRSKLVLKSELASVSILISNNNAVNQQPTIMKSILAPAFLVICLVSLVVAGVRTRDDAFASGVLSGHQKVVKDFVCRVMEPSLKRAEAVAGGKEAWLPDAADSLLSIRDGCSSSSVGEVIRAYENAQSVVTHCLTVQEIVKRKGPIKDLHVDELRLLFAKNKVAYYASAKLSCDSVSAGYDQALNKLRLAQSQNQLREIYLPGGERASSAAPSSRVFVAGFGNTP